MKSTPSLLLLAYLLLLTACSPSTVERANRLHSEMLTIDTHSDTPLQLLHKQFDLGVRHDKADSKVDFPRMRQGGLDAQFFAVFLGQGKRDEASIQKVRKTTNEIFAATKKALSPYKNQATLAYQSKDASMAKAENKLSIYLGLENGYPIGTDISYVDSFYQKGARYITLCHTSNNDICDSSTDTVEHNGLSPFGVDVVKRMNALGMMIDVSHISDKAYFDVIEQSKSPIFASHSSVRAVCDNPRNMTDDMIKALAKNGGVIQICILSDYVKKMPTTPERDSAFTAARLKYNDYKNMDDSTRTLAWAEWRANNKKFPATLASVSDLVDHIDHVVKLVGIDYVGIGTDFDGGGGLADCFDVSELKNITIELIKRGYSDNDIKKIWGKNFLRVFKEVEEKASLN